MTARRAAFTLIEMLIAISLGLVLIYTAAAGFRVASQSTTIANRMSLENAMLRAGFQTAHEQLDFWTDLDDPEDSTRRLLRGKGTDATGAVVGLPFTPLSDVWTGTLATDTLDQDETATGWDPRDIAWAAANPRGWYQGDMAEKAWGGQVNLRDGRYALFTNTADSLGSGDFSVVGGKGYGPVATIPHHWRDRTVHGLLYALGYYGLCEYLPANAIYEIYSPFHDGGGYWPSTNLGGIPGWCNGPQGATSAFCNTDGGQLTARSKYRNTYMTSYAMPNPGYDAMANLLGDCRRYHVIGYAADANSMKDFNRMCTVPADLLAARPVLWPQVSVSVTRFIKNSRHVAMCKVRWTSPATGDVIELSFAGFSTTLRGARQQRSPQSGWATWDNPGTLGAYVPPSHLDSPSP